MIQLQKSSAAIATLITFTLEGGALLLLVQAYLIFVADAADYKSQVFLKAKFEEGSGLFCNHMCR